MLTLHPIGTVRSPYTDRAQVPKGPGARHEADGVLELLPEFEAGLTDIEGFSHLYVLWIFDRAEGHDLKGEDVARLSPLKDRHINFYLDKLQICYVWLDPLNLAPCHLQVS